MTKKSEVQAKLSSALTAVLKPFGFRRKGSTWYLRSSEVIAVLNLQKDWGDNFYLNLGFWLQTIKQADYPKEYQCHIRGRAGRIWFSMDPNIEILLSDLETCDDLSNRIAAIQTFVREQVVPCLIEGLTVSGIRGLLAKYNGFVVFLEAQKALGLDTQ